MFENRCGQKRRCHPTGCQFRNRGEMHGNVCENVERRQRRVVTAARAHKRDGTTVIGLLIRMNALMQARRDTKCECPEKCRHCPNSNAAGL